MKKEKKYLDWSNRETEKKHRYVGMKQNDQQWRNELTESQDVH